MGMEGLSALQKTLDFIRQADSDIPIIGDGKRGDIGTCSLAYAKTLLENYNFDAVTVNPYMGSDAIRPFLEYEDKGVFVLCRTSNPSGKEIQELMVVQDGVNRPIYEIVAELALSWNMNGNVGLVVGATYPEQILHVREICPNMLFLIPGVGAQGGSIEKTVRSAADAEGRGFIINVSRQIMYAAKTHTGKRSGDSEAVKIRKMRLVARQLKDEINRCLPIPLKKTPKQTRRDHEDQILRGEPYQQTESSVVAISGR
jgi:orotidine-5'-phosphate decarboxylase